MNITNDVGTIEFDTQKYIDAKYDELEKELNDIENRIDFHCAFPFWGIVATFALGIFQAYKMISFAFNNFPNLANHRTVAILGHSFAHGIIIGIANSRRLCYLGGTIIYIFRQSRVPSVSNYKVHVFTGHEHKFLPYASLVAKDWKFDGTDQELVVKARGMYQVEVLKHGGENRLPLEHRLSIARGIAQELTC